MADSKTRIYILAAILFISAIVLVFSGCRTAPPVREKPTARSYRINGQWYHPITDSTGFRQSGLASWYGDPFHGRKTASGETYNMHAKTAAHKTLPLGTFVLVKNLENGEKTVVRVNDRGPFVRGRVIDLSYKAAKDIKMIGPGTAKVEVIAMEKGQAGKSDDRPQHPDFYSGDFTVQVGSFTHKSYAERLRKKLLRVYERVTITRVVIESRTFYRVRAGRFTSLKSAENAEAHLLQKGYKGAFAVACDGSGV